MPDHWHYAQLELLVDDGLIRPMISEEVGLSHQQAQLLRQLAEVVPDAAPLADTWASGAKDDTVTYGPFTWTLYPCSGDCAAAHRALRDEWLTILRQSGLDVQAADWPGETTR